jgi:hypothetical protein
MKDTIYKVTLVIKANLDLKYILEDLSILHEHFTDIKIANIEDISQKKPMEIIEDEVLLRNVNTEERANYLINKNISWGDAKVEPDECNLGAYKIVKTK